MNTDCGVKTIVSWKGVGEYLWISFDMNHAESQDAVAAFDGGGEITGLASKITGICGAAIASFVCDKISDKLNSYRDSIRRADQGYGVTFVVEIPLPGLAVGLDRFYAKGKDGQVFADFYNGSFSDLDVEISDTAINAPERDDGYRRLLVDLNKGAKGKYLYFVIKPSEANMITDLVVKNSNKDDITAPPGAFHRVPVDLNKGAKGDFIYAFWRFDIREQTIHGIGVIASNDSGVMPPPGYERINVDLNKNAGGLFIYLCYKK